jgi:hypothetical protein
MEKSSQIAWKLVPLRHFFPLKVVPLIKLLDYVKDWPGNIPSLNLLYRKGKDQVLPYRNIERRKHG